MYWGLILLAFAGLVPSILLPQWRQYESLKIAEQYEQYRLEQTQEAVEHQRRLLEAVRTDPAVVYRIAERELGIHPAGDQYVKVYPIPTARSRETAFVPTAVEPPQPIARLTSSLPKLNYDNVFCHADTRRVMIAMSVALLCVAFAFYGWRRAEEA